MHIQDMIKKQKSYSFVGARKLDPPAQPFWRAVAACEAGDGPNGDALCLSFRAGMLPMAGTGWSAQLLKLLREEPSSHWPWRYSITVSDRPVHYSDLCSYEDHIALIYERYGK